MWRLPFLFGLGRDCPALSALKGACVSQLPGTVTNTQDNQLISKKVFLAYSFGGFSL
jgi:hypothetical protein